VSLSNRHFHPILPPTHNSTLLCTMLTSLTVIRLHPALLVLSAMIWYVANPSGCLGGYSHPSMTLDQKHPTNDANIFTVSLASNHYGSCTSSLSLSLSFFFFFVTLQSDSIRTHRRDWPCCDPLPQIDILTLQCRATHLTLAAYSSYPSTSQQTIPSSHQRSTSLLAYTTQISTRTAASAWTFLGISGAQP